MPLLGDDATQRPAWAFMIAEPHPLRGSRLYLGQTEALTHQGREGIHQPWSAPQKMGKCLPFPSMEPPPLRQAPRSGTSLRRFRGTRERLSDSRGAAPIVGKCFSAGGLLTTTQVVGNKASVSV